MLSTFLFFGCGSPEGEQTSNNASEKTEKTQSYKDAALDYELAVMKGDTPSGKLEELKKALVAAILNEIPNTGFHSLWNMEHEIIDKWCRTKPKTFTDKECHALRTALLKHGDKTKDEFVNAIDIKKFMADTEFWMILISLKDGERKTLNGKLAYGYFSPENVKEATVKVKKKMKEHNEYWADKIEIIPGVGIVVTPPQEEKAEKEVEKKPKEEKEKKAELQETESDTPKTEDVLPEREIELLEEPETELIIEPESRCNISISENELVGWSFVLNDCNKPENATYHCFMNCGVQAPLLSAGEADLCYETAGGFVAYEMLVPCVYMPLPAPEQIECIDVCLKLPF